MINSNYRDMKLLNLQNLNDCDIILMSNISDYIKDIYNIESNYLKEYIKEIIQDFKTKDNKIVCAYLYDVENYKYRTEIDNAIFRRNTLNKLGITYLEKKFRSVIDNCIDSVIII